jgi:hypothetical protein
MSENGDYKGKQTYSQYEGGRAMSVIKATLIFCFTLLVCVLIIVGFYHYQDRFVLVGTNEGLFVYDRKLHHLNHCNSEICKTLAIIKSPEELALLMPEVIQQPVQQSGMICYPDTNKQQFPQQQMNSQMLLGHPSASLTPSQVISNQLQSAQQSLNASQMLQQPLPTQAQQQNQISKPTTPTPIQKKMPPQQVAPQQAQKPQVIPPVQQPQTQPQQKMPPFYPPQPQEPSDNNKQTTKKPAADEEEADEEEEETNAGSNSEEDEEDNEEEE